MVFVSSDWHGMPLDTIKRLLTKANFGDDDYLFVLGDVIDRGAHGIELLKYIMYEPNIKLIRGNHEQMMLSCEFILDEITDRSVDSLTMDNMGRLSVWSRNGSAPTIEGLARESFEMRKMIFEYVADTPIYDSVSIDDRDFFLVHGGLIHDEDGKLKKLSECSEHDLLWARPSLTTRYSTDFTAVFGHTPTCFFGEEYRGKILKTNTWIDIDVGAAMGIAPALLRLDDMKEFYLD